MTEKLDYLSDLGVTALWLLPFYPSPLKDDGYDSASYTEIHPDYGTLKDFKIFLSEAHQRGIIRDPVIKAAGSDQLVLGGDEPSAAMPAGKFVPRDDPVELPLCRDDRLNAGKVLRHEL